MGRPRNHQRPRRPGTDLAVRSHSVARRSETRFSADDYLSNILVPAMWNQLGYPGGSVPGLTQSYPGQRISEVANTLPAYAQALQKCPPAFAAQMVRSMVLSGARFTFRNLPSSGKAGKTFGTRALAPLEKPWPNGTTGNLVSLMEWHAGIAGNAYVTNRSPDRLRVLRPDWVAVVYGSHQEPEDAAYALDGELIGYVYANGGLVPPNGRGDVTGMFRQAQTLLPDEVAHFAPLPDPLGAGIGMSWVTPAVRDMQGDVAATEHKLQFFRNGATPNLVVKGIPAQTKKQFDDLVDMMESQHAGIANAYKTLYLTAGADATVVGSNFRDMDLKNLQGAGETRIAMLSRVPASVLQISEGLQGASLNAGNFGMARRIMADTFIYPQLQDLAASLAPMVQVPDGAELWFTTGDMPILREDATDAANIAQIEASTIVSLGAGGYLRDSIIAAVTARDMTLLKPDPNWITVQLQNAGGPAASGAAPTGAPPADGSLPGETPFGQPALPPVPAGF